MATDAEKAKAAADAKAAEDAAKSKAAEEAAAKSKGTEDEADDEDEAEGEEKKKYDEAYVKKLRAEAKQHRLEAKELRTKVDNFDRVLKEMKGEKGPTEAETKAQAETQTRLRKALLKSELANLARDAHEPKMLLTIAPNMFDDVEVNVENETVDEDALKEKIDELRTSKPYLFQQKVNDGTDLEDGKKKTKVAHDTGRANGGGTNHLAIYRQLKTQGKLNEAAMYFVKNNAAIKAQMKQDPRS